MPLELLFLGSGTSAGVPMIGCECEVCRSHDPRDNRTRSSVVIQYADLAGSEGATRSLHGGAPEVGGEGAGGGVQPSGKGATAPPHPASPPQSGGRGVGNGHCSPPALGSPPRLHRYLIDTTPELRMQIIRQQIHRIDGVLYTHAHADHIFGLDDLRRFNAVMERSIDIYAEQATLETLKATFRYVFQPNINLNKSFIPTLLARPIHAGEPFRLGPATWTPIRLLHGRLPVLGFRVDHAGHSLAYCTDVSSIPPESYPLLRDLDVLVLDALRFRHHPTHFSVDQAVEQIDHLRPRRAYLTHIAHDISHADLEPQLPEHVFLGFDGLTVSCGE